MSELDKLIEGHTRKRERIERRTLVGPRETIAFILRIAFDHGWHCTYSGPYTDKSMHPRVDITRSMIVLEHHLEDKDVRPAHKAGGKNARR